MKKIIGDPSPDKDGLSQEIKELTDIEIARYGISADVGNSLLSLAPFSKTEFENIAPIQTYEEYFRQNPGAYCDYVISKSDPARVQEYNAKIRAFNDDLERIKREKDDQKVQAFYDEMTALLRTKRV